MTFADGCLTLVQSGADYTLRQLAVLLHAQRHPGQSVLDIAAACRISKPAVMRAIDRLADHRLVDRVTDGEDRRRRCISATTAGVTLLARVGAVVS